ncbi:type II toxin-antitoxin system ParD family antitoxin [Rhizobium sp. TH2]|uniref:ribbon-helix-helix domain-containing protein n=1 Tax=Rhizobium sp. TH2 TaxID=2775403 RepID=UPI002158734B|nr:type II toxin-antitoxin system ParD family antitoxin [Rhizobium sp. TH2]UVC11446.1 type II toxin-antitoxin system ParD family antitoxin [Rhizobium sp. TH2]
MGRMQRLSVDIPQEVNEIVEEAVASGEFASASEMVSAALAEWKTSRLIHGYTVEELRVLVAEADEDEELIDGDVAFERIRERFEKELRERG